MNPLNGCLLQEQVLLHKNLCHSTRARELNGVGSLRGGGQALLLPQVIVVCWCGSTREDRV